MAMILTIAIIILILIKSYHDTGDDSDDIDIGKII